MDNIGLWRDSLRWSYRGLLDRYQVDAYTEPRQEWQYRYNPMGERESKREVRRGLVLDNQTDSLLPWQYYLLGGGKEQRAVWNGRLHSKSLCSDTGRRVYFYPSEYLTPGLGWTGVLEDLNPLLTRPNGDREYRISDHLGSVRVVLDNWGNVVQTVNYDPWGTVVPMGGPVAGERRTYNEKQFDGESNLGDLGVRRYDRQTGRFISADALWEGQPWMTPYGYADLNPMGKTDPDGMQATRIEQVNRNVTVYNIPAFGGGGGVGFGSAAAGGLGIGIGIGLLGTQLGDLTSGGTAGTLITGVPGTIGVDVGTSIVIGPTATTVENRNSKIREQIDGHIKGPVLLHLDKLDGIVPPGGGDPNDPRNRNDWKGDIKKALGNIAKGLKKLGKDLRTVLRQENWSDDQINNLFQRLKDNDFNIP